MKIVLASGSPRRKELLEGLGLEFEIKTADADETIAPGTHPETAVCSLAERKGLAAKEKHSISDDCLIISADTVVFYNNEILGKPRDEADAARMLRALSGSTHQVCTGIALTYGGRTVSRPVTTDIIFRELSDEEIDAYVNTKEPLDKAGAYGIQARASMFVTAIRGDYFATVGLPICPLVTLAKEEFEIDLGDLILR